METKSPAPSIQRMLLDNFILEALGDELGPSKEHVKENLSLLSGSFFELMKQNRSPLFDNVMTDRIETMENTFDLAFMKTMRSLNRKKGPLMDEWKWGNLHRGHFHIPIRETSIFSFFSPRIKDVKLEGSSDTVLQSSPDLELNPLDSTALCGYTSSGASAIFMNCAYSIDSMSDFYYGKMPAPHFANFRDFTGKHITEIRTASAR